MKKLLLSSIIMFGICGFVTAQNATESKFKKAETTTNTFTTATDAKKQAEADAKKPAETDVKSKADIPASDKAAAAKAEVPTKVNENGEVVTDEVAAKKQQEKMAAAKAANAKKNKDN